MSEIENETIYIYIYKCEMLENYNYQVVLWIIVDVGQLEYHKSHISHHRESLEIAWKFKTVKLFKKKISAPKMWEWNAESMARKSSWKLYFKFELGGHPQRRDQWVCGVGVLNSVSYIFRCLICFLGWRGCSRCWTSISC